MVCVASSRCPEDGCWYGSSNPLGVHPNVDEPCETTVMNLPVCANSDWKMYHLGKTDYYFCCPQGMVGLIPDSGRTGICQEEGARVPKSMLATVASQFGAGPTQSSGGAGNGGGTGTTGAPGSGSSGGTNGNGNSNDGDGGTTAGSSGSSNSGGGSGGVSTGAIAGIAVGGVAFLALVVALLLWFHRRSLRRHPATERAGAAHPPNLPQEPLKDVGAAQVHHVQGQHDVSQAVQYPMYSSLTPQGAAPAYNPPRTVAEVAAVSRAYEMEASRPSNAAGGKE
ncbi:hypothetical protein N657DRAFT_690489 [Parathielavia appendiculata]|uniref:Uncharacterized protein n=1 Tax=Parathielavia appendiculata TaxID=2587402 RepID=A0AAN6Z3F3_9PEZI|nr:hypothetical protein N657DRAFT_690489 [Parathielavia appendiculata]